MWGSCLESGKSQSPCLCLLELTGIGHGLYYIEVSHWFDTCLDTFREERAPFWALWGDGTWWKEKTKMSKVRCPGFQPGVIVKAMKL